MKAGYKEAIALPMLIAIIFMLILVGCMKKNNTITSLNEFSMVLPNGYLSCNFENSTISYERRAPETNKQTVVDLKDMAEYKELVTALCQEMIDNEDEYNVFPSPDALVRIAWWLQIDYDDGVTKKIEITEYAKQTYPDCWGEFVQHTNELTGWDVNELMIDPYDVPPKEIEDLKEFTAFFDRGMILFDYKSNQIKYCIYESEKCEVVEIAPEEASKSKEFMQQFCEDMLAHKSEFTEYPSETEPEDYYLFRVIYSSEHTVKTREIYISGGDERKHPDNWNGFIQRANELIGFDIDVLMTEPQSQGASE